MSILLRKIQQKPKKFNFLNSLVDHIDVMLAEIQLDLDHVVEKVDHPDHVAFEGSMTAAAPDYKLWLLFAAYYGFMTITSFFLVTMARWILRHVSQNYGIFRKCRNSVVF